MWNKPFLYVLGNPVEAALVESWSHWPGAISGPRACTNKSKVVQRPKVFFREDGEMPESLRLDVTVPPPLKRLGKAKYAAKLAKMLKAHEKALLEKHAAEKRKILGREAVFAQDPFDRPKNFEPRRGLNPRIACKDKWRRIEAIGRQQEFLDAYREAWEAFKAGDKNVVFPAGTYWMSRHAGFAAAPPG
jgi:hypothetical protein